MSAVVARTLATWFGCGRSPRAPGTVGTLGALPLYAALERGGRWPLVVAGAGLVTVVGTWAAGVVAKERGVDDPQDVVVDEVAGVLVALAPAAGEPWSVLAAVLLFRLFDVTKPFPAGWVDRRVGGGLGVMLDDVVAGLWAAAVLVVGQRAFRGG